MLLIAAIIGIIPLPYFIMGPGTAVDLATAIHVAGRPAPPRHFYLTDVSLQRTTPLTAILVFFPGYRIIPSSDLFPSGGSENSFQHVEDEAMSRSQTVAAAVGERAAGMRVAVGPSRYVVEAVVPDSPAQTILFRGDDIRAVEGHRVRAIGEVHARVQTVRPGSHVTLTVDRGGHLTQVDVPTERGKSGAQLGVLIGEETGNIRLPRSVQFDLNDVGGSSGGLMFALDVYSSLLPKRMTVDARKIAGTGTIALDGTVGPIEGTVQKLVAAKRAGATIFLCPKQNYRDVRGTAGVRIVPVGTFKEALEALGARS